MLSLFNPNLRIISASRRTDIPAFYGEWLLNRLEAGHVLVKNPYGEEYRHVSLKPDDVYGLILWSKNYGPLLPLLDAMAGHIPNHFFQFTITGLPRSLEPRVPSWKVTTAQLEALSRRTSSQHVVWRYDPLFFTGPSLKLAAQERLETFCRIADRLVGYIEECAISFLDFYAKTRRNLDTPDLPRPYEPDEEFKHDFLERLADAADARGIRLVSCCNHSLVTERVGQAHCIDAARLAKLWNIPALGQVKAGPTRSDCGCSQSVDIGAYDTCAHGCPYCYATTSPGAGRKAVTNHKTAAEAL